ncbi:MAG: HAD-IB family hydrolase [Gammaproteobacteria bacterium]|nr:HAD-IB family hydrolase [Gammaproteobacteria bacterium]NIR98150.1 HAD-IB family hydrolase [Gammaproteobacteria bacterium]NIT62537.1 HAD-IB family hydrolase [Gammaproteobacteria bacterium]NIV20794.1 HAD-IB family hydrolase [Gammaproteobacteria bacterium]NIY31117.1 HAD-IB family hydrolase [Gammaproteobacteria bacterium]
MALVLVDVDGTLFDRPSSEALFIRYLAGRGHIGLRQVAAATWFFARGLPRYGRHVARKNKAYLSGLDIDEVAQLAHAFADALLETRLRGVMARRLRWHREHGDTLALLSGTPEFIAAPLALRLGAGLWRATRCAEREGRFTGQAPTRHPLAAEKLDCARELCRVAGTSLERCVAYADERHDLPLLSQVGRPVAVYPDRGLARAARRLGWEVLGPPAPAPVYPGAAGPNQG